MPSTLRILKTTRENWSENLADATIEMHPMLKLMQGAGNLVYNCDGTDLKWTVQYKERVLTPYADFDDLAFNRTDIYQTASLDTRGYKLVDAISEKEMLQNKGKHAIIKIFGRMAEDMQKQAGNRLCAEFYVDGNATGNGKRFHGIESFMSYTSQTASDELATTLNDTYGGLSTAKGNYGGSSGERSYDFWSPVIVSTNRTGTAWSTDADQFLRRAIVDMSRSQLKSESLDLILLTRDSYRALLNLLDSKERVMVDKSDVGIRKFGFKDTVNFDGVDVTFDPDIPSTDAYSDTVRGYGLTTSKMKLKLLGDSLWHASGDDFDVSKQSFTWWVGLYGNLVFESPKHFAKFVDLA